MFMVVATPVMAAFPDGWSQKQEDAFWEKEEAARRERERKLEIEAVGNIALASFALIIAGLLTGLLIDATGGDKQNQGRGNHRKGESQKNNRTRDEKREGDRQHSQHWAKPKGKPEYSYYDILGVAKTADLATIKSAYRKMAMKFHPDNVENNAWAKSRFIEIQEAYEVLRDNKKRADYDRSLG